MEFRGRPLESVKVKKVIRLSKSCLGESEKQAVLGVLESEYLGMGKEVQYFEEELTKFFGRPALCVANGTAALHLSLQAAGVGLGDEILVQSLTYVASFQAISATGAKPVSCDINSNTFCFDWRDAESRLTSKTKAIMPVHYSGGVGDLSEIYAFAKKYRLRVIEDAAHAFGSEHLGRRIGSFGDIACFSFDGIKNITAGEGGAVLTSDANLIQKMQDGRLLGVKKDTEQRASNQRSWDFDVENQGYRFHMSNINAGIGIEQLKRIESFKEKRQFIAKRYIKRLTNINEIELLNFNYSEIIPHIFVIKVENRNGLRDYLLKLGIECGLHYKPNHMLKMYTDPLIALPITENIYNKVISLPCHVDLKLSEQNYVISKIEEFYNV